MIPDNSIEVESKWKEEIGRRVLAYENGEIPSDSMENVFKRLAHLKQNPKRWEQRLR